MPSLNFLKGDRRPAAHGEAIEVATQPTDTILDDKEAVVPDQNAQAGVQKIEAVTLVWTKWSLAALLIKYVTRRTHRLQLADGILS